MTKSHAAVVEADDETMQLSIAHGSVVCADDASAAWPHTYAYTRESPGREGAGRAKRERGARTREREPRGERCHGAN